MIIKLFVLLFLVVIEGAIVFAYRVFDVEDGHTVLAMENEEIKIVCRTGMPMAYCGFIDPNGKRYSFSGLSLADGHCAVTIQASMQDAGEWVCHIGKRTIGLELMQRIEVRVVSNLAAIQQNLTVIHDKDVTLNCVTTKDMVPLRYCRFEPPSGDPFSIDSHVNLSNAILGKYYYPTNKSLDRGDCAVTIRRAKYSDAGAWTCGAGLDDGHEYTDTIYLHVEGLYTMSTASTNGITFGAIGIVLFLVILGLIAWKKRRVLGTRPRERETSEVQELRAIPRAESRGDTRSLGTPERSRGDTRSIRSIGTPERILPILVVQSPSTPGSSGVERSSIFEQHPI